MGEFLDIGHYPLKQNVMLCEGLWKWPNILLDSSRKKQWCILNEIETPKSLWQTVKGGI